MSFEPVQWPVKSLGEVTINHDGRRRPVKESERKAGPFPYYGASGIVDYVNEFIFDGDFLLIGEDGENLRTRNTPIAFMAVGKFWVNNHAHIVTGTDEILTQYLMYFLQSADIQPFLTGAVMPKLTQGNLNRIPVRCPPMAVQEMIVKVLGRLDEKIDLNRCINKTLEAMAQAIFRSWFVDFAPVRAKIAAVQEGRDPIRAAMASLSGKAEAQLDLLPQERFASLAATAELFPDEMDESEVGDIPKGWEPRSLSELCDLNSTSWSAKTLPESVQYVDLANTKNGEILEVQGLQGQSIPSRARRILQPGDTIIGTVRPGNRSYALVGEPDLTGSTGFAVLRPKAAFLREFVYLAATADENVERLAHLADGGAYPAIRPELVIAGDRPIPSDEVLKAFNVVVTSAFDQILSNRRSNKPLADLRDTLLPKLLSGELAINSTTDLVSMTGAD